MIEHSVFLTPCLYPNYTIREVETPIDMIIHSFTPCGKFLICFTVNGVVIYEFNNQAGIVLDQHCFDSYFTLKAQVFLTLLSTEELSNDFCVATLDRKYIIVVTSSQYSPLVSRPSPNSLKTISVHADYHFHTISLITGKIVDRYTFKKDYIEIAQHRGVGLVQNIFVVLSLLHQTIHVIQINKRGEFHFLQSIGSSLYSDDALLQDLYPCMQPPLYNSKTLGALHQAILVFCYKNVSKRLFYQEFELVANLKIVRIQLMETMKLFLRMVPEEYIYSPMASSYVMFVIIDIPSSKVIDVFDNKSKKLDLIVYDLVPSHMLHQLLSKNKRLSYVLPLSLQRQIQSPYFNNPLFRYNDISVVDRSTWTCKKRIQFIERGGRIDKLKFTIDPNGIKRQHPSDTLPRLTTIIAHPTLPFVITTKLSGDDTIVNFHLCCL